MSLNDQYLENRAHLSSLAALANYLSAYHSTSLSEWITTRLRETNLAELPAEDFLKGIYDALATESIQPLIDLLHAMDRQRTVTGSAAPLNIRLLRELRRKVVDILLGEANGRSEILAISFLLEDLFTQAEDSWRNEVHAIKADELEKIQHFNMRVTNTIPGIIFILDLFKFREVYVNRNAEYFFGYSHEDLQEIGTDLMSKLIHPDDIPVLQHKVSDFANCAEGEIRTYEFRLKTRKGDYNWVRSYESVYRRTENGAPRLVIGIAIDINTEKKTSQLLERREQQLLQAQQIAGIGSFELEVETYTGEITEQAMKILDVSSSSALSKFVQNVHVDDRKMVHTTLVNAFEAQGSYDLECRYRAGSGFKAIWLRGNFLRDGSRQLLKGTVMDITARYNLLQQLTKSEQLYKQAEALSHIGNWNWHVNEDSIQWSDELFNVYGVEWQTKKITFDNFLSLVHPEDLPFVKQAISDSINNKTPFEAIHRVSRPDGNIRYVQAWGQVKSDPLGNPLEMFGTAQDITEKQLLLDKLKQSEQLYKEAQSLAHIGNWTWKNANNSFALSEELCEILEIPSSGEYLSSEQFLQYFDDEGKQKIENIMKQAMNDRHAFSFTYQYKAPSGIIKTMRVLGETKPDPSTNHIMLAGTFQDITEQERIAQTLRDKQLELEQSNTSLREYAYVASHDLQEPLRKISTFADRLRSTYGTQLPEAASLYVEKIISSSLRMQQMIHDLLSVSIISSERSFELVSLDRLFKDVLQTFDDLIETKKVIVHADKLPDAKVIPSQFRQLFQNLLSNSIKFSKKDTICIIDVTAKWLTDASAKIRNPTSGKHYLQLQFADNGIGFDNQFAEKIFTIFQRLHRKHEYDGTGIGLAICRRIAENHHGMIEASGGEGKGAVFTLIIPA